MKRALDDLCFKYDTNEMLQYLRNHPRFGDDVLLKTARRYYKSVKNCEYDNDDDCLVVTNKSEFCLFRPEGVNYTNANDRAAARALFRVYDNYQKYPIWATQQRVFTLILCLKRLSIQKDIIYCIAKMLWDMRYQN